MNKYRHCPPPGWLPIASAPRDGTVIEIQNNWGDRPWFGVFNWVPKRGWVDAANSMRGISSDYGAHLSWRPFSGPVAGYIAPAVEETRSSKPRAVAICVFGLGLNAAVLLWLIVGHPISSCITQ